jgi:hypothetical protein
MKVAAFALCAGMIGSAPAIAGPCAMPQPRVVALTPDAAKIDQNGGVVVGVVEAFTEVRSPRDLATLDWKFSAGAARAKVLAPGLAMLQPATEPKAGKLVVLDGKKQPVITTAFAHASVVHHRFPPKVARITNVSTTGPRSSSTSVTAEVSPAVTGAVAVLVYVDGEQAAGKPASGWARLDPAATSTTITLSATSRCSIPVGAGAAPARTDKVVLAFVYADGAIGDPTTETVVE